MMKTAILDFPKQFAFRPSVLHEKKLKKAMQFVVCGMGGSQLASNMLQAYDPSLRIHMHRDYGLPLLPASEARQTLHIFSSYSGNTEESLDGFLLAKKKRLPMAAIAAGGELLALSKKFAVPHIQLPDTGIQPRMALGFSVTAFLRMMRHEKGLKEARALARTLRAEAFHGQGKMLAQAIRGRIPVVYASRRNFGAAYNWKIKLNETGKTPAFCNVVPELNHNEMNAYSGEGAMAQMVERFAFLFIADPTDHPRVRRRMAITKQILEDRGFPVHAAPLLGTGRLRRLFGASLLADWTALYTADLAGVPSEPVPMVEEFKRMM